MAKFSNAQILASVLTEWSRPAISQIAMSKMLSTPMVLNFENTIKGSGLVGANYKISNELMPFMANGVTTIIEPILTAWLSKIPDESIPQLAHGIVSTAMEQPKFSILDGLVEFEQNDMIELKDLLEKNLPLNDMVEKYSIIR